MSREETPWAEQRRLRDQAVGRKREAVLGAAARLFLRKGFEYSTLNDIADELGVTKPTVYYYFKSKDQILLEIMHRGQDEGVAVFERAARLEGSGAEKLRHAIEGYAFVSASDFGRCAIEVNLNSLAAKDKATVEKRRRRAREYVFAIFEEGKRDGTLRVADFGLAYELVFGGVNRVNAALVGPKGKSAKGVAAAEIDLLFHGLAVSQLERPAATKPRRRP